MGDGKGPAEGGVETTVDMMGKSEWAVTAVVER